MKESNVQTTTQQPAAPPVNDLPRKIRQLPVSEVYGALDTAEQGIFPEEAQARLKKYGKNTIQEKKGQPLILSLIHI